MAESKNLIKYITMMYYAPQWRIKKTAITRCSYRYIALYFKASQAHNSAQKNNDISDKRLSRLPLTRRLSLSLWIACMPFMASAESDNFSANNNEINRHYQQESLIENKGQQRLTPPHPPRPPFNIRHLYALNKSQFEHAILLNELTQYSRFRQQHLFRSHQHLPANLHLSYRCFSQGRLLGGNAFQVHDLSHAHEHLGPAVEHWQEHLTFGVESYLRLMH